MQVPRLSPCLAYRCGPRTLATYRNVSTGPGKPIVLGIVTIRKLSLVPVIPWGHSVIPFCSNLTKISLTVDLSLFQVMLGVHSTGDTMMTVRHEMTLAMVDMPLLWPTDFGMAVANDRGLYRQVCNGRKPRAVMVERIRGYIAIQRDAHGLPHVAPADALAMLIAGQPPTRIANRSQ